MDANGTEQDAQNFMAANSLGQSPEQVISVIDSTYKRNQINSFLARIKDDINGIKDDKFWVSCVILRKFYF